MNGIVSGFRFGPPPHVLDEHDAVQEGIELGYLCSRDGTPCEFEDYPYKYGEDADGNRGEWRVETRCRKCGEYAHD